MDSEGRETEASRTVNKFFGHIDRLEDLVVNKSQATLPQRMKKLILLLAHLTYENELDFGVRSAPRCITMWDYDTFFLYLFDEMDTIQSRLCLKLRRTNKFIDAKPWPIRSIKKFLALLHGIKKTFDDLFPRFYAYQHVEHPDFPPFQPTLRRNIRKLKRTVAKLKEKLIAISHDQDNRKMFIKKIQNMKFLPRTEVDCPAAKCNICQVPIEGNINFITLDCCQHIFCPSCAKTWFLKKRSCLMCRREATSSFSSFYIQEKILQK